MNDNNTAPVIVNAAGPWLPAPVVPMNQYPAASEVADVAGEVLAAPLVEVETAYADADKAVADLEVNRARGNGSGWRQALADDAAAYGKGTRPKVWRVAQLLLTDPQRYAAAMAACGSLSTATARCEQRLDRGKIAAAAESVAQDKTREWAKAAAEGWAARKDPSAAWQHRRHGEGLVDQYLDAVRVRDWADRVTREREVDGLPPHYEFLPEDAAGRGQWLCLGLVLEPETWLRFPDPTRVLWPEEGQELVVKAMPEDAKRAINLREKGVHGIAR